MAEVVKSKERIQLQLFFDNGMNDGKQMLKQRNFNVPNATATDEDIYNCGRAIASLSSKALMQVRRADVDSLTTL